MVLQKHHDASYPKNKILRRQLKPGPNTATHPVPVKPTPTKPTTRPNSVRPITTTPAAPPVPVISLPPLLQPTGPTALPPTVTENLPPTTLSSISLPSTTDSTTDSTTSSSISVPPSTSVSPTPPVVAVITSTPVPSSTAAAAASTTNAGVLAGAIIGGCAALGLIAAAVFLFLRRRRQKKNAYAEAFSTSEFRRSAILLDDGREKLANTQPPNRIERHVQGAPVPNAPIHQQNHYTPAAGYYEGNRAQHDPFAARPPNGTIHQGPYSAQPAAYTYPPNVNPYGCNNPHGYPPRAHYPPHPQSLAQSQQYDTVPPSHHTHSETSVPFARQYDAAPLPAHYAQSETSLLQHPEPGAPPVMVAHNASSTVQGRHSMEDDEDVPPPAYEITETFANHRPDVKTRHLTYDAASSISASGSVVTPAPAPVPSAELSSPLFSGTSRHHTLSSRPVSGTSAVTIVYD